METVPKAEYQRIYNSLTEQKMKQITETVQQWVQPYIQALPEYEAYILESVYDQLESLKKP